MRILFAVLNICINIAWWLNCIYIIRSQKKQDKHRESAYKKWYRTLSDDEKTVADKMRFDYSEFLLNEYLNNGNDDSDDAKNGAD